MSFRESIVAIIPAYNEANRIGRVLEVVCQRQDLNEILVVDDGSTDQTAEDILRAAERDPRIRLLRHETNLGKGQAIFTALEATEAEYLLLLDADLVGLQPVHLDALIRPVLEHRADMSVGVFRGGRLYTDFSHWVTPWLSGQRCVRREILERINRQAAAGYGFETALTIAAYQGNYRTRFISLRGVWHTPSEFHRKHGILWRLHMYVQIVRAWLLCGGWQGWRHHRHKSAFLGLLLLFAFFFFLLPMMQSPGRAFFSAFSPSIRLAALPVVDLSGVHRILIVAPHPDDETLAAGGLIQQALEQNIGVTVVITTNGDAQPAAPLVLEKRARPRPANYIRMGQRRQRESLAALKVLGLPAEHVIFLGYPDRGLFPMWLSDWNTQCPFRAPYTKVSAPPYGGIFDTNAVYCGDRVLADLRFLLKKERPDLLVIPHPADQHPDHRALSAFIRMALVLEEQADPQYRPQVWGYIVHYASFPQPKGNNPGEVLLPPERLKTIETWSWLPLSPSQVAIKARAIRQYSSQLVLLGGFLSAFARRNELFAVLETPSLVGLDVQTLPLPAITSADMNDPDQVNFARLNEMPVRGNAIENWQVARLGNTLILKVTTRRQLLPGRELLLWVKWPDGYTQIFTLRPNGYIFHPADYLASIELPPLEHPPAIAFAAVLREGRWVISESGWYVAALDELPLFQRESRSILPPNP